MSLPVADADADAAAASEAPASPHSVHPELSHKYLKYGDREVAILISDMEGFTQTTRRLGIVHFASMVRFLAFLRH